MFAFYRRRTSSYLLCFIDTDEKRMQTNEERNFSKFQTKKKQTSNGMNEIPYQSLFSLKWIQAEKNN